MKNLLFNYLLLFYRTIELILRFFQKKTSPSIACYLQNIFLFLHGSKLRFYFDKKNKLFFAKEGDLIRHFNSMERGFYYYKRSLILRGESLAYSYCLQNIQFNPDDIVVDCGANYGDLFLYLKGKIKEENYIAFEPGTLEYNCISKSLPKAKNLNLGLSNHEAELDFYISSDSGDSSLSEPKSYSKIIKAKFITLDSFLLSSNINEFKLLKLEAEGWELEILEAAVEFIKSCEYIAVDGGRERGKKQELTLHKVNNYLKDKNFEMIDINGPAYRALYKNLKLKKL